MPPHRAVGSPTRFRPFSAVTACVSWLARVGRAGRMRACAVCRSRRAWRWSRRLADARGSMAHALRHAACCCAAFCPFCVHAGAARLTLTTSHGPGTRPGFSRRPGEADSPRGKTSRLRLRHPASSSLSSTQEFRPHTADRDRFSSARKVGG